MDQQSYVLGHDAHELERLARQAAFLGDLTEFVFRQAGIEAGMQVLDIGCGAGDVSFIAAKLVGPQGRVVGVDRAPEAVAAARQRAAQAGLGQTHFVVGDALELLTDERFDAVGRLVLMYLPDPSQALRRWAGLLRPGGIVAFQEFSISRSRCEPPVPLVDRCLKIVHETFRRVGADPDMGVRLREVFLGAGLPLPRLLELARGQGAADPTMAQMLVGVVSSLLPAAEKHGIASAAELDLPTLAERLCAEIEGAQAIVWPPSLIGGWTRLH